MEAYKVYSATKSNGDALFLAIDEAVIGSKEPLDGNIVKGEDYFPPGCQDIELAGELQITGDTHLLDDCITLGY